jgi:pimeloyl-ACP methyl ester carboxylesterase
MPQTTAVRVTYHTINVDGLSLFYREAGDPSAPTVLLLHGFPSSSRMYDSLLPLLADRYRVIAPDYPGFGHSDTPSPAEFAYTFSHLAEVVAKWTTQLGLGRYSLFVQDYGGPIGMRLALAYPERLEALIIQNAVSHEVGLGPLWEKRRAYWRNRASHEPELQANLISFDATRLRHVGTSPHPERYNPDLWVDEYRFLSSPGQQRIQTELFYDYHTNVTSYPAWQRFLRERRPPTLVLWGRYDPSFAIEGAHAYRDDVPDAEIHILEAGHFALDEATDEVASLTRAFLAKHVKA